MKTITVTDIHTEHRPNNTHVTKDLDPAEEESPGYNYSEIVRENNLAKAFRYPATAASEGNWCRYGLLYVKVPKAASSTTAGITRRIAAGFESRLNSTTAKCIIKAGHTKGQSYRDRHPESFLFATVRDPTKRAISRAFFQASNEEVNAEDGFMMNYLTNHMAQQGCVSRGMGGFQMSYIPYTPLPPWSAWIKYEPEAVQNAIHIHDIVRQVIEDYNFIIVVERYDESLVALQLLLGLRAGDILYLSSKSSGDYYLNHLNKKCVLIQKSRTLTPNISFYLSSNEWIAKNYGDYVLQEAASQSLDLTIDAIGKEIFGHALQQFISLKIKAGEECSSNAKFPCMRNGTAQIKEAEKDCFVQDEGCGRWCLDQISFLEDHKKHKTSRL